MKIPTRSLLALATALTITLGISSCGSDFHPRYAYLQEEDLGPAVVQSANSPAPHVSAQTRRAGTHVKAAAKTLGQAAVVDIGSGTFDVYVGDLSGRTRLLAAGYDIWNVLLSSDRTKIVMTAYDPVTDTYQVYVADSKLNTVTQLTFDLEDHYDATISPDGLTVAYDSYNSDRGEYVLYTVPAAGGTPTPVPIVEQAYDVYYPTFTPDGQQFVYTAYDGETGTAVLGIVNLDGSSPAALTWAVAAQRDFYPSVSPDGSLVTFTRITGGFLAADIYQIPIEGEPESGAWALTDDDPLNLEGMFADSQIVFLSQRGGPQNIWSMDSDGSNQMRLTTNNLWQFFNRILE